MEQLFKEINLWAEKTFPDQTVEGKLNHLRKEIDELDVEVLNDMFSDNAKEELADCFILLFSVGYRMGLTLEDLITEMNKKLEINKKRKWGKINEKGYPSHER